MKKINEWKHFFLSRGIPQKTIDQYLEQIKLLAVSNSPIIFEVEHLSLLLGIEYLTIQAMINGTPKFYREFTIKKEQVVIVPYMPPIPVFFIARIGFIKIFFSAAPFMTTLTATFLNDQFSLTQPLILTAKFC